MNELQIYAFESTPVRIQDIEGVTWWVLADVCKVLGIANPRDAAARLDDDEKDYVGITDAIGRERQTLIINESGLNALIMSSRKPAAQRLRKWVTGTVIPALRKDGGYIAGQAGELGGARGGSCGVPCEGVAGGW